MSESNPKVQLLKIAYRAFNNRNLAEALQTMKPDVIWPNGMEGGVVLGHEGVRNYWTRQWGMIDPHVDPIAFTKSDDGKIIVTVHQVVKDLDGKVILDQQVTHTYSFANGLISSMEIGN
ncbi:MAG: hypothetical protein C5B52_19575 [Bacteroidetes bacterium]|nr:MAG: hypothetical protein C5B52_19575 [Bacteroidota bacterium]